MIFASPVFLFLFLPLTLLGYTVVGKRFQNVFLLAASLFFYAWGETWYVVVMLASILINYLFGLAIEKTRRQTRLCQIILLSGVVCNLSLLLYFKYANFFLENLNALLAYSSFPSISFSPVHLPIGISFFTFQAMSYVIDVYRNESPAQSRLINCALYIALFPQLIAGPIVRYHDIAKQIVVRTLTSTDFSSGIQRFIFGLSKKVLLANPLGEVVDKIFVIPHGELTSGLSWLGIVCYAFQIYFDFSGYSDMAIGLGRMFGFHFLENFNYPYISQSIQEFWRRWHISLSTWFRDYLYIPLGGSRGPLWRTYLNLCIVFALCGFWHGASWNFLVWGLLHGSYLVFERLGGARMLQRLWRPLRYGYTLCLVLLGWVFFRAENISHAMRYLEAICNLNNASGVTYYVGMFFNLKLCITLCAACLCSTPVSSEAMKRLQTTLSQRCLAGFEYIFAAVYYLVLCALFILSAASLATGTYNPFIYFRF